MDFLKGLLPRVFGFLTIIVVLALSPSINSANETIAAGNLTNLIGMGVMVDFGAPLIVLGLIGMGIFFLVKGTGSASIKDLLGIIGSVIFAIVALTFMDSIVDYTNTLIGSSDGFALIVYGIIPLVIYLLIIGMTAWQGVKSYQSGKGKGKGKKAAATAGFGSF